VLDYTLLHYLINRRTQSASDSSCFMTKDTAIGKHNREGWVEFWRSLDKATDKNPTTNQTLVNVQNEITINHHHHVGYWNNLHTYQIRLNSTAAFQQALVKIQPLVSAWKRTKNDNVILRKNILISGALLICPTACHSPYDSLQLTPNLFHMYTVHTHIPSWSKTHFFNIMSPSMSISCS
jgi:hypothetical protein